MYTLYENFNSILKVYFCRIQILLQMCKSLNISELPFELLRCTGNQNLINLLERFNTYIHSKKHTEKV